MMLSADTVPLSLAHLSALDLAPPDLIDAAARAEFASVGLRLSPAVPGGTAYPLSATPELTATRRRLADTGISVLSVELIALHRAMRAADCLAMLETGAALGATRIAATGDDPDFAFVSDRLAELCDLARNYGMAVDLEFMRFRAVQSLMDAAEVIRAAQRPNAHILVDALHFFRSTSDPKELSRLDARLIGGVQLCDAPSAAPADGRLADEARARRLLPGTGGLPLWRLVDALPSGIPVAVELPIAWQYPELDAVEQIRLMAQSTRQFLRSKNNIMSSPSDEQVLDIKAARS